MAQEAIIQRCCMSNYQQGFGRIDSFLFLLLLLVLAIGVYFFTSPEQIFSTKSVLRVAAPSLCVAFFGFSYHVRSKITSIFERSDLSRDERFNLDINLRSPRNKLHSAMVLYVLTTIAAIVSSFSFLSEFPVVALFLSRTVIVFLGASAFWALLTLLALREIEDFNIYLDNRKAERERTKKINDDLN